MPDTDRILQMLSQMSHRRRWLGAAGTFAAGLLIWPAGSAAAWSRWPGGEFLLNLVQFPALFAALGCVGGFLLGLLLCALRSTQCLGAWCALYSAAFLAGSVPGFRLSIACDRAGWHRVMARGEPLIAAVHRFETRYGGPPETLTELVPEFLPAIPTTGIGSSPAFHYQRAAGTYRVFDDRWAVRMNPPQLMMGFDTLFYTPSQNYPEQGFGGGIERIGKWAYVHE